MAKKKEPDHTEEQQEEPGAERISHAARMTMELASTIELPHQEVHEHLEEAFATIDRIVASHEDPVESGHSLLRHYIDEARRLNAEFLPQPIEQD